jgi:phosphoribosyl 1,2-cyclic phosphodiesterase
MAKTGIKEDMLIRFWGVRGSIPTPMQSPEIEELIVNALRKARPQNLKNAWSIRRFVKNLPLHQRGTFGGNTSCVEVQAGSSEIIFDAGSGLKNLGRELMRGECGQGRGQAHIFISHTHWDHIQGFPFFTPAYIPGNRITVYSPLPDIAERFKGQFKFEYFPVTFDKLGATIDFQVMDIGKPRQIADDVTVSCLELNHPGRAFGYKVEHRGKKVIYATDVEYTDLGASSLDDYINFFQGGDVLVSDSQYTLEETFNKKFWGHSSAMMGVELALKADVKTLVLFHHEPEYDGTQINKIVKQALEYQKYIPSGKRCTVLVGHEGLVIKV